MTALLELARYSRASFGAGGRFTRIGEVRSAARPPGSSGSSGASDAAFPGGRFGPFEVTVPSFTVVAADWFDAFLAENALPGAPEGLRDDEIAMAFQRARLPVGLVGDLRALMEDVRAPLALRSSSLLEDALEHPFAGVYGTKMTPNDQLDADTRFNRMVEAVKFVWASTFFAAARAYRARVGAGESERMAVLVQEVVGRRHRTRHYPDVSGVARSLAFYQLRRDVPGGGHRPARARPRPDDRRGRARLDVLSRAAEGGAAVRLHRRAPPGDPGAVLGGADGRAAGIRPRPARPSTSSMRRSPTPRRTGRSPSPPRRSTRAPTGSCPAWAARGRASSRSPRSSSSTSCRSPRS